MDDELLERLITKLIGLTEFGALRWHFAGDVSKAFVTVYKNARLKLTEQMLDITEAEGDTVRIDPRLHKPILANLILGLQRAARESADRFRTGQVQVVSHTSLISTCRRLLDDEEQISLCTCLVCSKQFDLEKTGNHLSQKEELPSDKNHFICEECVAKLGVAVARSWLATAASRKTKKIDNGEDIIGSDTLLDVPSEPPDSMTNSMTMQEAGRLSKKEPESR